MTGTLASEMARRKAKLGVVTICIGGGQGAAGFSSGWSRVYFNGKSRARGLSNQSIVRIAPELSSTEHSAIA
jgi:hypothetical protein